MIDPARVHHKHLAATAMAVALSVGLHLLIFNRFPPLPVGKPPEIEPSTTGIATTLERVFTAPMPAPRRPERYRPEDPSVALEMGRDVDEFTTAIEQLFEEAPASDPDLVFAADDRALVEPVPSERAAWASRQEILWIEEKIYADEVSALPRHYLPAIERVDQAPDVTLPVDFHAGDLLVRAEDILARNRFTLPRYIEDTTTPAMIMEESIGKERYEQQKLVDVAALTDEGSEEITAFEPIEQLLDLNVYAYQDTERDGFYFKIEIQRHGPETLPVLAKDVLFIQDGSRSMTQAKLNDCKQGIANWLNTLRPEDRFNIITFKEEVTWCFESWKPVAAPYIVGAHDFIKNLRARGKTDVYASLRPLLGLQRDMGRPVLAVFITDGRPTMGLVDSSEIIETFSRENRGSVSVFAFGGGRRVNRYLLELLSYKNRGDSQVVHERREIPGALAAWGRQLRRPVLADLQYRFSGLDETEIYPKTLTHLYLDYPLTVYGWVKEARANVAFRIVGYSAAEKKDVVFPLDLTNVKEGDGAIAAQWARHKAYHLIGGHIQRKDPLIMEEIQRLAREYDIYIPYGGEYPLP